MCIVYKSAAIDAISLSHTFMVFDIAHVISFPVTGESVEVRAGDNQNRAHGTVR